MKSLLVLALMSVSLSSHALIATRLTDLSCFSADGKNSIAMKHISTQSSSSFQAFLINGMEASNIIIKDDTYKAQIGDALVKFKIQQKKNFVTTMTIAELSDEDKDALAEQASDFLDFGGEEVSMNCFLESKVRLLK